MQESKRQHDSQLEKISTYLVHGVVPAWHFTEKQAEHLRRLLQGTVVKVCGTAEEFAENVRDSDAVLTWTFRQEWFDGATRLKILSTPAAGKDYFTVEPPSGVWMMNGQFHGEIISESVVGMLLAMERGILPAMTEYEELPWPRKELAPRMRVLRGSTAMILGFGNIGRWIGKMLKPFGLRIFGISRHRDATRPEWFTDGDLCLDTERMDAYLPETDHLILALPGTTGTTGIVDGHRLQLLKKGATLTNIGRGNAVVAEALMASLENGQLSGAFLDVFPQEPLPASSPLMKTRNLWRLPHACAIADNYLDLYVEDFVQQLKMKH
ncbi:MAG: hypothetical protein IKP58_06070 [Victivallales bacterium]|nr:hypothetical protein [Victivallales bacterium]